MIVLILNFYLSIQEKYEINKQRNYLIFKDG